MIRKPTIRKAAQVEIDKQADYLAENAGETVARRFLDALDETITLLCEAPEIGPMWDSAHPLLHNVRRYAITGFRNHLLFYRTDAKTLEVMHLFHAAQNIESRIEVDEPRE